MATQPVKSAKFINNSSARWQYLSSPLGSAKLTVDLFSDHLVYIRVAAMVRNHGNLSFTMAFEEWQLNWSRGLKRRANDSAVTSLSPFIAEMFHLPIATATLHFFSPRGKYSCRRDHVCLNGPVALASCVAAHVADTLSNFVNCDIFSVLSIFKHNPGKRR